MFLESSLGILAEARLTLRVEKLSVEMKTKIGMAVYHIFGGIIIRTVVLNK